MKISYQDWSETKINVYSFFVKIKIKLENRSTFIDKWTVNDLFLPHLKWIIQSTLISFNIST